MPRSIKTLEPKALRGVDNDAMCMSNFELGISDEHEGIILLEDDAPVGVPAADFIGDVVLEIDVLPNMARCLSMIGVAREVAALIGTPRRAPPHRQPRRRRRADRGARCRSRSPTRSCRRATRRC